MTSCLTLTFHGLAAQLPCNLTKIDSAARFYMVAKEIFQEAVVCVSREPNCTTADFYEKREGDWAVITFDDGLVTDYEIAFPILRERNLVGTFFITVNNIGLSGYLSKRQLIEMADGGMEIGSHGLTHSYLVTMARDQARREIIESKDRLEQTIGKEVLSFAPVGGHFDRIVVQDAREAGYHCFASMIPGVTVRKKNNFLMRRNHLQACHDAFYLNKIIARDPRLLSKNAIRYRLLRFAKISIGMQRYDRLKSRIMKTIG